MFFVIVFIYCGKVPTIDLNSVSEYLAVKNCVSKFQSGNRNIFCENTQSINCNFDQLMVLLDYIRQDADIIVVETWNYSFSLN